MKRVIILAIGLLLLMSVASFASQTRTMVMGNNGMIMVDDNNIHQFPGRVNNYPDLALAEFGGWDDFYNFGITWQFNDDNPWVLGTFVSTQPYFEPETWDGTDLANFPMYWYGSGYGPYFSSAAGPRGIEEIDGGHPRRIQMLYGRQIGGQNFGLSIDVVRFGWEAEKDSTQWSSSSTRAKQEFHEYTFGLGLTEATSGQWDVSLSLTTGGWTNENDTAYAIDEPDGYSDFGFAGRYFMVRNPKVTLVPHFQLTFGKRGVKSFDDPRDFVVQVSDSLVWNDKFSRTAFEIGIGMNYTPGPDMLAVLDFGLLMDGVKLERSGNGYNSDATAGPVEVGEVKEKTTVFPYIRIGFEGEVFSWMDFRAGATGELWTSKSKTESTIEGDYDILWNEPNNRTYLGFGFHWGRLYLDTYSDPELILRGPNFVTGDYDGSHMNWMVSATYELF